MYAETNVLASQLPRRNTLKPFKSEMMVKQMNCMISTCCRVPISTRYTYAKVGQVRLERRLVRESITADTLHLEAVIESKICKEDDPVR